VPCGLVFPYLSFIGTARIAKWEVSPKEVFLPNAIKSFR
jgi:hypothetical protein